MDQNYFDTQKKRKVINELKPLTFTLRNAAW